MLNKLENTIARLSGKYRIDFFYFIKNSFWTILNQSVIFITTLGFSILSARLLTKQLYGEYQFVASTMQIVALVSLPLFGTSLVQSVASSYDGNFKQGLKIRLLFSLMGIPILIGLYLYFYSENSNLSFSFLLVSLLFPFIYSFNIWSAFLQGKALFKIIAKRQIVQSITQFIVLILTLICFKDNIVLLILMSYLTPSILNLLWYKKTTKFNENNNRDNNYTMYGWFLTKVMILNTIVLQFDKIIVGFFEIELLAVVAIAINFINIFNTFFQSAASITFPKFAKKRIHLGMKKTIPIIIVALLITSITFIFAEFIIKTLYSEKYIEAAYILKKIVFVLPFILLNAIFRFKSLGEKNKKILFHINVSSPILTIIISLVFFLLTNDLIVFIVVKIYLLNISILIFYLFFNNFKKTNSSKADINL